MEKRKAVMASTAAVMASVAVSLGVAAPAGAAGPPPEVVTTTCDGGTIVLVVRGEPTTALPGTCVEGSILNAWPKKYGG